VIPSAHVRKKLRLQFVVDRLICASSKARTPEANWTFALADALLRRAPAARTAAKTRWTLFIVSVPPPTLACVENETVGHAKNA
jgi:hypothetical protein